MLRDLYNKVIYTKRKMCVQFLVLLGHPKGNVTWRAPYGPM